MGVCSCKKMKGLIEDLVVHAVLGKDTLSTFIVCTSTVSA